MRGSNQMLGRFDRRHELGEIRSGINTELRNPVGVDLEWWQWDAANATMDSTYDVGSYAATIGRTWLPPIAMPAIVATYVHGGTQQNDRGFYTVDSLHITLNTLDVQRVIPRILTDPDPHMRDRIIFRGGVFTPTNVYPRGHWGIDYTVVTVIAQQVNPEELVNDPQFQALALAPPDETYPRV